MKTSKHIVVLVTAKDKKEARKIAGVLLEAQLIACANILQGIESVFRWQGKIDHASEALLVMKTKRSLFKKISAQVKAVHSYSTPEIIALPMVEGDSEYLKWIDASVVRS